MREIKFRAWDKTNKKMYKHEEIYIWDRFMKDDMSFQYAPLMQYTGLKDRNGKEIYEGDIVEYDDFSMGIYLTREQPKIRSEVRYNDRTCGFKITGKFFGFKGEKVEVVGNIYENPELLEVE